MRNLVAASVLRGLVALVMLVPVEIFHHWADMGKNRSCIHPCQCTCMACMYAVSAYRVPSSMSIICDKLINKMNEDRACILPTPMQQTADCMDWMEERWEEERVSRSLDSGKI